MLDPGRKYERLGMDVWARLGLAAGTAIDPDVPLAILGRSFDFEARASLQKLLLAPPPVAPLSIIEVPGIPARYVSVIHERGETEIFSVPSDDSPLPTAAELCLIQSLFHDDDALVSRIFEGGIVGILNADQEGLLFANVVAAGSKMLHGETSTFNRITAAMVESRMNVVRSDKFEEIIIASLQTYPRKFRFVELYRILENQYIKSIKDSLDSEYVKSPEGALSSALAAIQSELNQLVLIASRHQDQFEAFFNAMKTHELSNRLAAALFKKIEKQKGSSEKHVRGAGLIYSLRCAIVHAGVKDIMFESFVDGDTLLGNILDAVEVLVCACNGIEIQE